MNILLAEDEPVSRRIAAALLERAGHCVTAVPGGTEAVAAVATADFDLVLLDVHMGAMDGPAAARGIRARRAAVPILALTASPWPEETEACRAAGMNGCLTKPLDLARLDAALRDLASGVVWVGEQAAAQAAQAAPLLDEAYLAALAADLTPELFRASLLACEASMAQTTAALATVREGSEVAALAHKLRGTAATYGLKALHHAAGEVEALARGGSEVAAAVAALLRLAEDSRATFAAYRRALG